MLMLYCRGQFRGGKSEGKKEVRKRRRESRCNTTCYRSNHSFKRRHRHLTSLLGWLWETMWNHGFLYSLQRGEGRRIYLLDPSAYCSKCIPLNMTSLPLLGCQRIPSVAMLQPEVPEGKEYGM